MSDVMNLSEKTKVKVKIQCAPNYSYYVKGMIRSFYFQHPDSGIQIEMNQDDLDFIEFAKEIEEEVQRIYIQALANQ